LKDWFLTIDQFMMANFMIRLAIPTDFQTIAQFIEANNQNPATQCIQSSTGEEAESLLTELRTLHASGEILFFLAWEKGQLQGVIGCEIEEGSGRGWLRGPIIAAHSDTNPVPQADFLTLARELYHVLTATLPPSITIFDSFLNVENTRGQAFYESQGFTIRSHHHVYLAPRPTHIRLPPRRCPPKNPEPLKTVRALHKQIFPKIQTGEEVLSKRDENHPVGI
jgi:hypothetical protein